MKTLFAALAVALVIMLNPVAPDQFATAGVAAAQEVPVMGEDGWILPENDDDSSFDVGRASQPSAAAPAPQQAAPAAPVAAQSDGYYGTVAAAAAYYGLSADYLWGVVGCETGYTYRHDLTGPNGEYGPFQFMESTFYWFAGLSGHGGSWGSAYDQAWVAAWAFSNGYSSHWVCA